MMRLPKAVQEASERSEALQKQINEGKPHGQPGTTPQDSGTPKPDARDTLPPVDKQTPPETTAPEKKPADSEETWEQRYKSLRGKYESQVPRLQQDNRRLQDAVSSLENEVSQLKKAAETPKSTQDQSGDTQDTVLDKDSITYYGEEFGPMVEVVNSLKKENGDLKKQISDILGEINKDRTATAEEKFNSYMRSVVSHISYLGANFDTLNNDPAFLSWLAQVPAGDFESRHSRLKRAEFNMDLEDTNAIFTEYLGSLKPDAQEKEDPKHDPPPTPPNVQPPPSNPGSDITPPGQESGKVWTRQMIAKLYDDKKRGVFKGREEEFKALEQDLYKAQTEGRLA